MDFEHHFRGIAEFRPVHARTDEYASQFCFRRDAERRSRWPLIGRFVSIPRIDFDDFSRGGRGGGADEPVELFERVSQWSLRGWRGVSSGRGGEFVQRAV